MYVCMYVCMYVHNSFRSGKPAKGQIICQRTDYLSFHRFTDLLNGRGMKPTTRTRAQNPLPEFFEVAVEVQTTVNSSLFEL